MTQDYTIFASYLLSATTTGYSTGIHCNYITSINIETNNFPIQEIIMNFSGGTTGATAPFKYLNSTGSGTGFTANKIYAIVQSVLINPTGTTTPNPANWKLYDLFGVVLVIV